MNRFGPELSRDQTKHQLSRLQLSTIFPASCRVWVVRRFREDANFCKYTKYVAAAQQLHKHEYTQLKCVLAWTVVPQYHAFHLNISQL